MMAPAAHVLGTESAARRRWAPQDREASLAARESELSALQEGLQEERSRLTAEAARLEERARDSLRVVREAEEDYLAGRDRLDTLEREVGAGGGKGGWAYCRACHCGEPPQEGQLCLMPAAVSMHQEIGAGAQHSCMWAVTCCRRRHALSEWPRRRAPLPQIAATQEDIERLADARGVAEAQAAEAEAAAQQALEAGHAEVMKLRRKWDELSGTVAALARERDALLDATAEEKAQWARMQQVGLVVAAVGMVGAGPRTHSGWLWRRR